MTMTSKFDVRKYLTDSETMANYLSDCLEEGGIPLFLKAIGEVARARGMSELANNTGLTRASLYKALGEDGNPALSTMALVVDSLDMKLVVVPKEQAAASVAETRTPYRVDPSPRTKRSRTTAKDAETAAGAGRKTGAGKRPKK